MRLRRLEEAVGRIDLMLRDEQIVAYSLVQCWRNEHTATLPQEIVFDLSRGIHNGDPAAFAEWQAVYAAERRYIRQRAADWLADLPASDRRRWTRMLAEIIGP